MARRITLNSLKPLSAMSNHPSLTPTTTPTAATASTSTAPSIDSSAASSLPPTFNQMIFEFNGVKYTGAPHAWMMPYRGFEQHMINMVIETRPDATFSRFDDLLSAIVTALAVNGITATTSLTDGELVLLRFADLATRHASLPAPSPAISDWSQSVPGPLLDTLEYGAPLIPADPTATPAPAPLAPADYPPPPPHVDDPAVSHSLVALDVPDAALPSTPRTSTATASIPSLMSLPIASPPRSRSSTLSSSVSTSTPRLPGAVVPRRPSHIADDETYNRSRAAYAMGVPAMSPMYCTGKERHFEQTFYSAYPHAANGVWTAYQHSIILIAAPTEDISLLTLHNVEREQSATEAYHLRALDGATVARVAVFRLAPTMTCHDVHAMMAGHNVVSISGLAAAFMIRHKLTDGVFSKSFRRIVMGIDPVMMRHDPVPLHLFAILTDHRLDHAATHAVMSMRLALMQIESASYQATKAWLRGHLPVTIFASATTDSSSDSIHATILEADKGMRVADTPGSSTLRELEASNTALQRQVIDMDVQINALLRTISDLKSYTNHQQASHGYSIQQYLHSHTCVNTQELPLIQSVMGDQAANAIQAMRMHANEAARSALTDKVTAPLTAQLSDTMAHLHEARARNDDLTAQLAIAETDAMTAANERDRACELAVELESQLATMQREYDQTTRALLQDNEQLQHSAATAEAAAVSAFRPTPPLTYGTAPSALPAVGPGLTVPLLAAAIDPASLLL
nr:non-structural protein NS1 [Grass carp reovirus]